MKWLLTVSCSALTAALGSGACSPNYQGVPNLAPAADPTAPDTFTVAIHSGNAVDPIVLEVNRDWSPNGADRFFQLVRDGYYNCAGFFRVVPDFVVQFGIAAVPEETAKWDTVIPDDTVVKSNSAWTVSFATAGPNTRTTQLFINYVDNFQLDSQGFSPFAIVTSGFETALTVTNPTPDNSNGVNQLAYTKGGNEWLLEHYPNVTLITQVLFV